MKKIMGAVMAGVIAACGRSQPPPVETRATETSVVSPPIAAESAEAEAPPSLPAAEASAAAVASDGPVDAKDPKAVGDPTKGLLTIVCNPPCDEVIDELKSLGPSPIVRRAMTPGIHRLTIKRTGVPDRVVKVVIVAGEVTAERVSMRPDPDSPAAGPVDSMIQAAPGAPGGLPPDTAGALLDREIEMQRTLEPKVWSGQASIEEIRLLRAICAHRGDRTCRDRASAMLKQRKSEP